MQHQPQRGPDKLALACIDAVLTADPSKLHKEVEWKTQTLQTAASNTAWHDSLCSAAACSKVCAPSFVLYQKCSCRQRTYLIWGQVVWLPCLALGLSQLLRQAVLQLLQAHHVSRMGLLHDPRLHSTGCLHLCLHLLGVSLDGSNPLLMPCLELLKPCTVCCLKLLEVGAVRCLKMLQMDTVGGL